MSKEIIIEIFASDLIPSMLFGCKEDADRMDIILKEYTNNEKAIAEFKKAENQYASLGAVLYHIEAGDFHFKLEGDYSDELICAAENMVDSYDTDVEPGDPYTPIMYYIFHALHPNVAREE